MSNFDNNLTETNITNITNNCIESITKLITQYKDNEYGLQRIYNHIVLHLPNTIDNELKIREKRINRNNYLSEEQHIFIQVFLNKNKYYYLQSNNFFYEYDGEKYMIVKEDDIIHKLLSTISKDRILLQWKYKTKVNVIKQIKDRSLFNSIPETDTIQNVLNVLYPSFFLTKNSAKYFLTIIGDNILKKQTNNIFLVSQKMKQFLNEIDSVALSSINNGNTSYNFMTKYHENHSYEFCRLIKINENFSIQVWREILKKIGLDLLCVSAHYSKRYENSDTFMNNCVDENEDEDLKQYTYYLKNTSLDNIITDFCGKYIIEDINSNINSTINSSINNYTIEWKNLHFIWKQFLSTNNFPNFIYSNTLKNLFKQKYVRNEEFKNEEFKKDTLRPKK